MRPNTFAADKQLFLALEERSRKFICDTGRTLFNQGDSAEGLYIVRSGEASLLMLSSNGTIIASYHAGCGAVLGLPAVVGKVPYTLSAIARRGSELGFIAREDFEELLRDEPPLYPSVLNVLAAEIRSARASLAGIESPASQGRVVYSTSQTCPVLA